jgi:REP element-mobilizing transposase RayT
MPRPPRPDIPDGWYHVMNRGIDHGTVFFDDHDRIDFGQRLADVHSRFGVEFHAYCLLDNHYHLLVHCPDGALSEAMQRLGSMYTRQVNDRRGRDGALFRGRFHSRRIDSDEHLVATCRYIHRNALDLPGVTSPERYRWSSHRAYLGYRSRPPWLSTATVLQYWGGDVEAFDRFVRDAEPTGVVAVTGPDARALVEGVAAILAEWGSGTSTQAMVRTVAVAWALDRSVAEQTAVASELAIDGPNGWRCASWRARRRIARDPTLAAIVARLDDLLWPVASRSGSDPDRDQRAARAAS